MTNDKYTATYSEPFRWKMTKEIKRSELEKGTKVHVTFDEALNFQEAEESQEIQQQQPIRNNPIKNTGALVQRITIPPCPECNFSNTMFINRKSIETKKVMFVRCENCEVRLAYHDGETYYREDYEDQAYGYEEEEPFETDFVDIFEEQ